VEARQLSPTLPDIAETSSLISDTRTLVTKPHPDGGMTRKRAITEVACTFDIHRRLEEGLHRRIKLSAGKRFGSASAEFRWTSGDHL